MINASELRIGNWVNVSTPHPYYGGGFKQVDEINEYGIGRTNGDSTMHDFEELSGIPLSPALLERCGFVEIEDEEDGSGWNRPGMANSGNFIIWNFDGTLALDGYSDAPLNYVHQLQNAFYALTGTELTITL